MQLFVYPLTVFKHSFIDFVYFAVILCGFLVFWLHDVIVTWCDVIIPRDVYQKKDVLNILFIL